jgi:hypothetical protein
MLAKVFPTHYLINRYLNQCDEYWAKGNYYLGGQIPLKPDDEITDEIILEISKINSQHFEITNSFEAASVQRSLSDFLEFQDVLNRYKRKIRFNGILRTLVFWISPARKRATEKVFHPYNIYFDNDGEIRIKNNVSKS